MRFLVDENLSPQVAALLSKEGHDATHVYDLQAASAPDATLMAIAATDDRIIISADTDFGALLASTRARKPSVLLVREIIDLHPTALVDVILQQLEILEPHLQTGAIAAFTTSGIRVRALPLR